MTTTRRALPWLLPLAALAIGSTYPVAADRPALDVGARKQLFIDQRFIEGSEGIALVMNAPHQTGERLVVADQPWEKGAYIGSYSTVLREEGPGGPRVRLWYDLISGDGVPGKGFRAVAYAESSDGIRFRKPILGLVAKDGSKENNLVIPTDLGRMTVGGGSVLRDDNPDAPPGARYKSWSKLYQTPGTYRGTNRVWHSGDGLRWQLYEIAPTGLRASDTQPTWFWDPRIRRYVGYSREWVEVAPGRRVRMVGYNESDDMLHWEQFTIAIRADDRDPAPPAPMLRVTGAAETEGEIVKTEAPPAVEGRARFGAPLDFYGPSAVRYAEAEDVYLAMLSAFYHWRAEGEKSWPDTADVQLAVSRDGRSFQRLGGRKPFLRLGPEGSFYSRWLWALPEPIRMGDELWIYYVGSNEDHSSRVDPRAPGLQTAVTRAVLRLDGFVSADADYAGGWLTTPPVVFAGSRLELNLDTSAGGSGRVEVQDAAGRPIPGFSLADADELRGNSVRLPVSWKGSLDVARLAGRPVKLHFKLRDAKLYAFQFVK